MAIPINTTTAILDRDTNKRLGIKIHLTNSADGYFDSTTLTVDAVKENIRGLINTRKGERLFQPNLGLGLENILFDNITDELKLIIEDDIKSTLKRWLPFVYVQNINIEETSSVTGLDNSISIKIDFGMTYTPNMTDSVEIVIN